MLFSCYKIFSTLLSSKYQNLAVINKFYHLIEIKQNIFSVIYLNCAKFYYVILKCNVKSLTFSLSFSHFIIELTINKYNNKKRDISSSSSLFY